MADNVTTPQGTFASDDIGGVQHPRTKVGFGADGSYADVSQNAPLPVAPSALGQTTRLHNTAGVVRQAVGAVSSAEVTLPALNTDREVYVMASTRCFFLTGETGMAAASAGNSHPLAADERFYLRIPAGHTHFRAIRDAADGFITIMPVA